MPYPNSNILNIIIPQTSASIDPTSTQAPFVERIISGSRLVLQTDTTGTLIGSSDLNVNSITASNISASGYISASNLYVRTNITDAGTLNVVGITTLASLTASTALFSGMVSASAGLSASAIYDVGTLTVLGNSILSTITASNISASGKIVATDISASNEVLIGSGPIYKTWTETNLNQDHTKLYVSGSATLFGNYATLTLATSASDAGAQSNIIFSRLGSYSPPGDTTPVLLGRMALGIDSGSNDLRVFGYYASTDPENNAFSNINAGTRAIFKQNGYFGIGSFISYGQYGGSVNDYKSSLPGFAGQNYVGPDALLTLLPADSGSVGTALSRFANRNILNIMSYDTSSIMFISGSDGYVLLGKNTTDGINRLQVVGNVSASAYTGSSANFTNLIATNITSSNISASGNISASSLRVETSIVDGGTLTVLGSTVLGDTTADTTRITGSTSISGSLTVIGNSTLSNVFATNVTASNISASGNISSSTLYVVNNATINGDLTINGGDIILTSSATMIYLKPNEIETLNIVCLTGSNSGSYMGFNTGEGEAEIKFVVPKITIANSNDAIGYLNAGTSANSASLQAAGGATFGKSVWISGSLNVRNNFIVSGSTILGDSTNDVNTSSGSLKVLNTTNNDQLTYNNGALIVDGGVGIGKNLFVSGSMLVGGDFTVFGSSSVVYISSSTVIINDNIIQLNAYFPFERYAGFEVFDSGSNQRSASLLWDGDQDNWITVDQNNSSSNMIIGPTASFGSVIPSLTINRIPKAYDGNAITNSLISDDGTTLLYTGTRISASAITSSTLTATTGSITYITGALVTYITGSFTTLTISTGSAPNAGGIVPQHPTASGMAGQINVDNNFVYVYTNNIWKRVPLSNWSL